MSKQVGEVARNRARTVIEEANRIAMVERLEPAEVAERLGMSWAHLRLCASRAGMRYRRQPGFWVPADEPETKS